MRVHGRFVQEQVLYNHTLHRLKTMGHVLCIWIRLNNIFTYAIQRFKFPANRLIKHVGNTEPRLFAEWATPSRFK